MNVKAALKILVLFFVIPVCIQAQSISEKADALLNAYYQQDLFTGTVLIAKGGSVVFEKSYGLANREKGLLNSSQTQYRIGSLSKPITALIILQLKEKGLLTLHDPLSNYLPHFSKGDSVNIENLLNHTSGIRSITSTKPYMTDRNSIKGQKEVLEIIKNEPYVFTPGSKWQYSNSNFILLSYIAEKITGKSMAELVKAFAAKYRMKNTGIDYNGRTVSTKAIGYEAGTLQDYEQAPDNNIAIVTGAGAIYSTAADLYALDRALYTKAVLSEEAKKEMFTLRKGEYALGWETGKYKGRTEIGHSGSIEGFKSNILRYPESDICIIFLSNYWNTRAPQICESLKAIVFDEPYTLPAARSFIALSAEELKALEGDYSFRGAMTMNLKAEAGRLLSMVKGQPVVSFRATSGDAFYNKSNDAVLQFKKDQQGKITSFTLVKGRQEMEWQKVN
jgi:CubicO group peptidase (beta-lactamase class C family)